MAGEHGIFEARGGDGLAIADVLGVEVVFESGIIELDVVAFEDVVHEKVDAFGGGVAVIDLVVGGETDGDGQRRDVRLGRIIERDVVVLELGTAQESFRIAFRSDGLAVTDVLVRECVVHLGRVNRDIAVRDDTVDGDTYKCSVGIAVIDLVVGGKSDGNVLGSDIGMRNKIDVDVIAFCIRADDDEIIRGSDFNVRSDI